MPTFQAPSTEPPHKGSPLLKNTLITFALILLGTFIGVLASRFVPMTPTTDTTPEPELTPTEEMMPIETPVPEPTATSSALLDLKWNMMTVKSPLTAFNSYRIYYPTTWSIKEYKNTPGADESGSSTLTLTKDNFSLKIVQAQNLSPVCDYSGNPEAAGEGVVQFGEYRELFKEGILSWRWGPTTPSLLDGDYYLVCQGNNTLGYSNATSIGFIEINRDTVGEDSEIRSQIEDEVNYILEKIIILP